MVINNSSAFAAQGLPVLIGSLPLDSHEKALDLVLDATPEIPLWPQLPANPQERMLQQFAEGIPCIREENPGSRNEKIYYDITYSGFEEAMLAFYEEYLLISETVDMLDNSSFKTGRDRAAGLYLLAEKLKDLSGIAAVKGQVTGPFTMLTGIKDQQGKAGYFDDTIRDMVIKGISMKAAWQARLLKKENNHVLLFIDEPALAGLGSSAFIGVSADEIRLMVNEVAEAIHLAGGLAGIHVCANTDWGLLLESEIDILSFDAYGFFDRIAPLTEQLSAFLNRGGIIAWGLVPTSRAEDIEAESVESLSELWKKQAGEINGNRNKADILQQTLITPSCGTGSLTPDLAQKVLNLTSGVSRALRSEFL